MFVHQCARGRFRRGPGDPPENREVVRSPRGIRGRKGMPIRRGERAEGASSYGVSPALASLLLPPSGLRIDATSILAAGGRERVEHYVARDDDSAATHEPPEESDRPLLRHPVEEH